MRTIHRNTLAALTAASLALTLAACSSTTGSNQQGEELTLYAPLSQSLERGETNKVTVRVHRSRFEGDVALAFDDLPKGVEVVEQRPGIQAGDDFGEVTLYARPDADIVAGHAVRITALADGGLSAVQWFDVAVTAN